MCLLLCSTECHSVVVRGNIQGVSDVNLSQDTGTVLVVFIKWVPCHHVMMCPQVVDGGDGLHV